MQELIVNIAPNLASKLPDFYKALGDTMLMVLWSGLISFVFGLLLGVVLTVTKPNGILENKVVYQILDKLVSLFRSIPFIILLTWVMPITRALVGTVLYVRGAIVPLVFGSVPFFTRQVESALAELDGGLIEAALSMGSSPLEIIFRVYLKESIAAIARGTTITIVSLLNLTAMAVRFKRLTIVMVVPRAMAAMLSLRYTRKMISSGLEPIESAASIRPPSSSASALST